MHLDGDALNERFKNHASKNDVFSLVPLWFLKRSFSAMDNEIYVEAIVSSIVKYIR